MQEIKIRNLGLKAYEEVWQEMKNFSQTRTPNTLDEIWLCEHPKVFTTGLRDTNNHILSKSHYIPIIKTDRGGLITHHGPNQIMFYLLFDLRKNPISPRCFVTLIQDSVVECLKSFAIKSYADIKRPGVFVLLANKVEAKVCSIGLRFSQGKTYHGLCLNYAMDLSPFSYINPCGYQGLEMANIKALAKNKGKSKISKKKVIQKLTNILIKKIEKAKQNQLISCKN